MQVQVLPCVVGFVHGQSKMKCVFIFSSLVFPWLNMNTSPRIVGFEELPGGDGFTTATLELTMSQCGESVISLGRSVNSSNWTSTVNKRLDIINSGKTDSISNRIAGSGTTSRPPRPQKHIRGGNDSDDDFDDWTFVSPLYSLRPRVLLRSHVPSCLVQMNSCIHERNANLKLIVWIFKSIPFLVPIVPLSASTLTLHTTAYDSLRAKRYKILQQMRAASWN